MTLRNCGVLALLVSGLPVWAGSSSVPGIDNFHQVDQNVYRGAQPTDEGFRYLGSIGVKIVIDLREHDKRSVTEEQAVASAGMRYVNVPMGGLTPPTEAETNKILAILEDPSAGPVFVHCKRGADRTGAVIAAYRIDHDKWGNGRALDEAMADHMSRFQTPRQNFIRKLQTGSIATVAAPATAVPASAVTKN